MESVFLKEKGQVSVEFLLIFMIALIYIYGVVQPSIDIAMAAIDDVSRASQVKLAAEKLANSANELLVSQGEAKKTIHILVPEKASVYCDASAGAIKFDINLSEKLAGISSTNCTGRSCNGSLGLVSASIACPAGGFSGKKFYTVELARDITGVVNVR